MSPIIKHLEQFGEPSEEDYALIQELLPSEVPKGDIFVYCSKLCDNKVDRQKEFFSSGALEQLKEKFVGVTGLFNHDWKSDNQHSRIYKTELVTDTSKKNESYEPYSYIVGFAYTLNTPENQRFIRDVKSGILKEVSIGFEHESLTPIVLDDGKEVKRIDSVSDVYEWSFVAVPSQRHAGVVKSFTPEQEVGTMKLAEALAKLQDVVKLKSFSTDTLPTEVITTITSAIEGFEKDAITYKSFETRIKSLEGEVEEKGNRVKELEQEITTSSLENAITKALEGLNPVSDTASQVAKSIAEKGITIGEDGQPVGVDETKSLLQSDYGFLFGSAEAEEVPDEKAFEAAEKSADEQTSTKSFVNTRKSLDFTRTSSTSTQSTQQVAAPVRRTSLL
jgi:phage head maturation protease